MESSAYAPASAHSPTGATLESRLVLMSYNGGFSGMFSPQHKKLEEVINRNNAEGFRLKHVLPGMHGPLAALIQLFFLMITLMIWAPVPGETLIFERQR